MNAPREGPSVLEQLVLDAQATEAELVAATGRAEQFGREAREWMEQRDTALARAVKAERERDEWRSAALELKAQADRIPHIQEARDHDWAISESQREELGARVAEAETEVERLRGMAADLKDDLSACDTERNAAIARVAELEGALKDARYEAWDDWMLEFGDGLEENGVDWEALPVSPRPGSAPHGTRMADSFCLMFKERDALKARVAELEGALKTTVAWMAGFSEIDEPSCERERGMALARANAALSGTKGGGT